VHAVGLTGQQRKNASKQAVAYCWHSPAWLFLVLSPIGTHDHIFVLIYNPYGIRQWASSSLRGGLGLFNAAGLCQLLYLGLPLVCLLHFKEAEALQPRQGSSPWGGGKTCSLVTARHAKVGVFSAVCSEEVYSLRSVPRLYNPDTSR
jgi:hypothetical protein